MICDEQVFALLINAFTSLIDVSADALATDSFSEKERAGANGTMFCNQVIGTSLFAALGVMLLAKGGV